MGKALRSCQYHYPVLFQTIDVPLYLFHVCYLFLSFSLNSHVLNNEYCMSFFQLGHGVRHLLIDILEYAHICKPTTKKKEYVHYKANTVST